MYKNLRISARFIYENINIIKTRNVEPILIVPLMKSFNSNEIENKFITHYSNYKYPVVIIEQQNEEYNPGALKNIGFDLTHTFHNYLLIKNNYEKVYIFQDANLLIDDQLQKIYSSNLKLPVRLSNLSHNINGGDIMILNEFNFIKCNGFSLKNNTNFLSSQDMIKRLALNNTPITCLYSTKTKYIVNSNEIFISPYIPYLENYEYKKSDIENIFKDGLTSLNYNVTDIHKYPNQNIIKVKIRINKSSHFGPLAVFPYSFSTFGFSF